MKIPTIFISYVLHDRRIARQFAKNLTEKGFKVWFDENEILAGDLIIERIRDGISKSDYLLILISKHSVESKWVTHELTAAINQQEISIQQNIIPVRIDASTLPAPISDIRYIDYQAGHEEALNELLQRLERDQTKIKQLTSVMDTEKFVSALAKDTSTPKGPEFYITTLLSIITLIVTIFLAWPSFQIAFSKISKVYYDEKNASISLPPGTDEKTALNILEKNGIAPAGININLINRGQVKATEIKIGATFRNGEITGITTDPKPSSKPVWVNIKVDPNSKGSKEGRLLLNDLVPEKPFSIFLGYKPKETSYACDVVADGILAIKVDDIRKVPTWSLYHALKGPLKILIFGLLLSFLLGVFIASFRNERLREKLIAVVEAVVPTLGKILRILNN